MEKGEISENFKGSETLPSDVMIRGNIVIDKTHTVEEWAWHKPWVLGGTTSVRGFDKAAALRQVGEAAVLERDS